MKNIVTSKPKRFLYPNEITGLILKSMEKHEVLSQLPEEQRQRLVLDIIKQFSEALKVGVQDGLIVVIPGVFSARCVSREPRNAYAPKLGKCVKVPSRKSVSFKPAPELKQFLNE